MDLYVSDSSFDVYSNFDDEFSNQDGYTSSAVVGEVAGAVGSVAQLGGSIAQAKATKEASKSELEREIEASCGKRKRFISGKKREENKKCREDVIKRIESRNQMALQTKQQSFEPTTATKPKKNNTILFISVSAIILIGIFVVIKLKNRSTAQPIVAKPSI